MPWPEFLPLFAFMCIGMYLMRLIPVSVLSDRELSPRTKTLLGYIPPACFAALVANDLLSPSMFLTGIWPGLMPLIATAAVVLVAAKTKSMVWCIVVGIAMYALLGFVPL